METMAYGAMKQNLNKGQDINETLKALAVRQQGHNYKVSLYNLLFNYMTFLETVQDELVNEDLLMDKDVDFLSYMLKPLQGYQDLSSFQLDTKELLAYREKLEVKMTAITNYADELDQYEYIINRIEGGYMDQVDPAMDDETLAAELIRFIFAEDNNFVITEKMKTVLSQLPIRMTKQKFLDYVSQSMEVFIGSYVTGLDDFVIMVQEAVIPYETEAYRSNFSTIREGLEELRNTSYKGMDQKSFESVYGLKCELADQLNCLAGVYSLAVSILNNLIEISLCDLVKELQEDQDIVRADHMFNRMYQSIECFGIDELMAKALEGMEGVIEENLEEGVRFNSLVGQAMNEYQDELRENNRFISFENIERLAYMSSTTSYFADVFAPEQEVNEEQVNDQILATKKEQLVRIIDGALEGHSREYRRSIMSKCFYLLPVCFKTPEEVHEYMLEALKQCSDQIEKNAIIEIIVDFMDMY